MAMERYRRLLYYFVQEEWEINCFMIASGHLISACTETIPFPGRHQDLTVKNACR